MKFANLVGVLAGLVLSPMVFADPSFVISAAEMRAEAQQGPDVDYDFSQGSTVGYYADASVYNFNIASAAGSGNADSSSFGLSGGVSVERDGSAALTLSAVFEVNEACKLKLQVGPTSIYSGDAAAVGNIYVSVTEGQTGILAYSDNYSAEYLHDHDYDNPSERPESPAFTSGNVTQFSTVVLQPGHTYTIVLHVDMLSANQYNDLSGSNGTLTVTPVAP